MDEFREMWFGAANNRWSYAYLIVVVTGAIVVVGLSLDNRQVRRRVVMCLATLVFTVLAMMASSLTISEKWRIRHEWSRRHEGSITEEQMMALNRDGANLVFGPVLFAGRAFLIFCGVGIGSSLTRRGFSTPSIGIEKAKLGASNGRES